jgi:hypothetical protein
MKKTKLCAYCSKPASDHEHVFPKCLYPPSKNQSKVQRLTIPACKECNNSWADDEAHFRNVIVLAGEPGKITDELWETMQRSFKESDGKRRLRDIVLQLKPVGVENYKIYPGQDERILRVVKKVIRGLSYYHRIMTQVSESLIWVDILKFQIQQNFVDEMNYSHREEDIAKYRYQVLNDYEHNIYSAWIITFLGRVTFIGTVEFSDSMKNNYKRGCPSGTTFN